MTVLKTPPITLGDRLRICRRDAEISSEGMAELFAIDRRTITNWETGKATPSLRKIRRWADLVAERTDYKADDLYEWLSEALMELVASIEERRRNERRALRRRRSAWNHAAGKQNIAEAVHMQLARLQEAS